MKIFIVQSKSLQKSGTLPFTVFLFQRYKVIKIGKMIEKNCAEVWVKSMKIDKICDIMW